MRRISSFRCLQTLRSLHNALLIYYPHPSLIAQVEFESTFLAIRLHTTDLPSLPSTPQSQSLPRLVIKPGAYRSMHHEYTMRLLARLPTMANGFFATSLSNPNIKIPKRNYPAYQPKYPPTRQNSGNAAACAHRHRTQVAHPS